MKLKWKKLNFCNIWIKVAPPLSSSSQHGVKRARCEDPPQYDTEAILNDIFSQASSEQHQPVAKKTKRAYTKKQQNKPETQPQQAYLSYQDICAQQNSNQEFDDLEDDDDDEENYSVNSFGERKKRVLTRTQRIAANQRERKRMNIMNESYVKLRQVLPIATGRKRRKMSRLDIVVGAMEYISYLADLVERDEPCEIKFDIFKNCLYDYD